MITIREYARPATLEEAWQLNQKRPNRVLGGMLWLKMEKISVGTAIDLSALGLDTIEETDTEFAIGAMATLRSLETHAALNAATNGAMREAVRHIVGVQFRNCANVGQRVRAVWLFRRINAAAGAGLRCGAVQSRPDAHCTVCRPAL